MPNFNAQHTACVSEGSVQVTDNTIVGAAGIGLQAQGGPSPAHLLCGPAVTATGNLVGRVAMGEVPSSVPSEPVAIGDCIDYVDLAGGEVRDNRCLGAARVGLFFGDAATTSVTGNEVRGAAVVGSVDGEQPESVLRSANAFTCSGLDDFQENGGWPRPGLPTTGVPGM